MISPALNITIQLQEYTVYTDFSKTPMEYAMTAKKIPATAGTTKKAVVPTKSKVATLKVSVAPPTVAKKVADKPGKKIKKEKKSAAKAEVKVKVVRDSFTMPQADYAKISELKQVCLKAGLHVKKSELLRAGLRALSALSLAQLKQAIGKLDTIKTGRPKKSAA
jgi:hypothetical protein